MSHCRCGSQETLVDRRFSRRSTLRAGGIAALALATRGRNQAVTLAQEATPPAGGVSDLTGVAPLPLTGERLATYEAYLAAKLVELELPGAAVAVIQGGEVVFLQGFGVREIGQPEPVTADTLMRIGSVTKSFSSLLAATLVDAGRLRWDTPLADLLPGFALADADLTARLTVRDAFCACTGLPRRDLEFMFRASELTPELMIESMARLPLTAPFGEKFQYSNQMVAAGGFAAGVADGGMPGDLNHAYAMALRDRVLNPIGMPRTTLSLSDVLAEEDYAAPHASDLAGNPAPLPLLVDDEWIVSVAPTGGLWSSAREMARYVQTELARGAAPNGRRVVSAENLEATWKSGVPISFGPQAPAVFAAATSHYALAWEAGTYGSQRLISHSGFTYGFNALVAFLPDAGLGLVVLTNRDGAGRQLGFAAQYRLFELLFDQPETIEPALAGAISSEAAARADLLAQLGQVDPATVTPYLGQYANPDLGPLTLALQDGKLVFTAGAAQSGLAPLLDDAGAVANYVFVDPPWATNPPERSVSFSNGADGQPQVMLSLKDDDGMDLNYLFELV